MFQAKNKFDYSLLWPGSGTCARRSKTTQERRTTLRQSWASIVSSLPGIGTTMINCLFIEPGTVNHRWFVAGSTSQMAGHH